MKKAILLALALVMVFALAACGSKDDNTGSNDDPLNRPSNSTSTITPSGNQTGEVPNMADILSGKGGGALVSSFDEATKQAFIAEAKADGYDVTFGADGSMTMTDKATGEKIVQKPDGTWSIDDGQGGAAQVGGDWPDNEFTKLLPKPDFTLLGANVAGQQFTVMLENVKIADMRSYVEQVKEKGFTVSATTNDQEAEGGDSVDLSAIMGGGTPDKEQITSIEYTALTAANTSGNTFSVGFASVTVEQVKAYVEQVKAKGFTVNPDLQDENMMGIVVYSYEAKNADGYKLTITFAAGTTGLEMRKP